MVLDLFNKNTKKPFLGCLINPDSYECWIDCHFPKKLKVKLFLEFGDYAKTGFVSKLVDLERVVVNCL